MQIGYLKKIFQPHILKRILTDRVSEPIHVNLLSFLVGIFGTYKQ
jgi:hypothetical protein